MHRTLTFRGNLNLIALWCAILAICTAVGISGRWPTIGLFALVGLATGVLQGQAIRTQRSEFLAATSSVAVRKALLGSRLGQAAVALLWLTALALLGLLFLARPPIDVQTAVAAYAAFALSRESAALPAVRTLATAAE